VLSGGEKNRMMYGKLILTKPNVMLMDEPTNHMDMETIESLQIVSRSIRARWFSSRTTASSSASLATRA